MTTSDRNLNQSSGDENIFDPLRDVLLAQFAKPDALSSVNLRALSPFQRALLIIDGTVTTFLEVYTLEPIEVHLISNIATQTEQHDEWLDMAPGSNIALREVIIQGTQSQTLYVYAVSSVALDRFPIESQQQLASPGGSLGRVINDSKIESRREILWYGREQRKNLPDKIRKIRDESFVSRTYRIISGTKPIALVHEKFPTSLGNALAFD